MTSVLLALEVLGWPMMVTEGLRTTERQQQLYAQGRTTPGAIVTNADGVKAKSKHQSGRSVDCAFLDKFTGKPTWSDAYPWKLYGEMVKSQGLIWGGDWREIVDKPHAQLPPEVP